MFEKHTAKVLKNQYSEQVEQLKQELDAAECVLVGAGAGLSASAGFDYSGERFKEHFSDFEEKYGFHDMYSGGFYPYATLEEYWAYWSRNIMVNRYYLSSGKLYADLKELVKEKPYFIITTNVDHCFQTAGFDKSKLFYTQGDYGLWQCSRPCHDKTYDNKADVFQMVEQQKNMKIPPELIPKCPVCGAPMTMNLRCDDTFVQDEGWYAAAARYNDFISQHKNARIMFLELGVGYNTPGIIKYPFWRMTKENPQAVYACINNKDVRCPKEIEAQALCIRGDIGDILNRLRQGDGAWRV